MNKLTLDNEELNSLKKLIAYLFDMEKKHYEECNINERNNHIHTHIKRIDNILKTTE